MTAKELTDIENHWTNTKRDSPWHDRVRDTVLRLVAEVNRLNQLLDGVAYDRRHEDDDVPF